MKIAAGHHETHLSRFLGILDLIGAQEDQCTLGPAVKGGGGN